VGLDFDCSWERTRDVDNVRIFSRRKVARPWTPIVTRVITLKGGRKGQRYVRASHAIVLQWVTLYMYTDILGR
jgi:hypothetical protein